VLLYVHLLVAEMHYTVTTGTINTQVQIVQAKKFKIAAHGLLAIDSLYDKLVKITSIKS